MKNFKALSNLLTKIKASSRGGKQLMFERAILRIVNSILALRRNGNKIMLIGNGGSASIASHIATDFLKNCSIAAVAFNDSSLITCISNDLGYENVFKKPIEILSRRGDIVIAVSSSGKSRNILDAANQARKKGCFVITLSGFRKENPLRELGDINFYVPSNSYGHVEIIHLAICHLIVDKVMEE